MSDAKKTDANENSNEESPLPKKGFAANKKKIIVLAVAALFFISLMGVGSIFLIKSLHEEDPEAALETENNKTEHAASQTDSVEGKDNKKEAGGAPAIYISLKPAFVVNFKGENAQHFLQLELTLLTHEPEVDEMAQLHMPLLRNAMVMLLGDQSFDELQTTEGKEKLRQQALIDLQAIMKKETGQPGIEDVYFTSIAMQ